MELTTQPPRKEKQTNSQIRENRRAMDKRARRAFEDEHKGPSKFAGKRVEHRTQEELRWRVPHGLQWESMETIEMQCGLPGWPTYRRYALTSVSITQQVKRVWV
jgi:hypothetical protein